MDVEPTDIPGVLLIQPKVFGDARGTFVESYSAARYGARGLPVFVQDNLSCSRRGVLRGLHMQNPFAQGKLVTVLVGAVFDVVVDVRVGSPTFGRWAGFTLDGATARQLYIPPGLAHGFCALRDDTLFSYKCTELYHPEAELGLRWDDPDLGIAWPLESPSVSDKDAKLLRLRDLPRERLVAFAPSAP